VLFGGILGDMLGLFGCILEHFGRYVKGIWWYLGRHIWTILVLVGGSLGDMLKVFGGIFMCILGDVLKVFGCIW